MELFTKKNTVVFDLEATGLKIDEARIIAIGAIKINPKGEIIDNFEMLVNPMQSISAEIAQITGITNETLKKQSAFGHVAEAVKAFFKDCNLAGFNLTRFDLPLLAEEFARCGFDFPAPGTKIIDSQVIYHTNYPRTLSAALKHYCQKEHTNAHDAMGDTIATLEVLEKQLQTHDDVSNDVNQLHEYSMRGKGMADWTRLFYYDAEGVLRFNFSKHKDDPCILGGQPHSMLHWMLDKDFPRATKLFIRKLLAELN